MEGNSRDRVLRRWKFLGLELGARRLRREEGKGRKEEGELARPSLSSLEHLSQPQTACRSTGTDLLFRSYVS